VDQGFADGLLSADQVEASARQEGESRIRAEKKFDLLAARAGLSRGAARELLAELKGGKPGAAPTGTQDAAVIEGVRDLLNRVKSI
jgi:hypothetical protein